MREKPRTEKDMRIVLRFLIPLQVFLSTFSDLARLSGFSARPDTGDPKIRETLPKERWDHRQRRRFENGKPDNHWSRGARSGKSGGR